MNLYHTRNVTRAKLTLSAALFMLIAAFALPVSATNDKYRLSWRDDPATTMVIGWNQIDGANPTVHWGTQDQGQVFRQYDNASRADVIHNYRGMSNHFVRLTGLQPDTAYYFVIKDSNSTSRRYWFRTAPDQPKPFAFVAGGDTRTNQEPRRQGNAMIAKLRPLFVCHGGDYMGVGSTEEWKVWFDDWQLTISEDGRMYPLVAAHGNHENQDMAMIYRLFDGPRSDMYFAMNVGGPLMRLYTLNTEIARDQFAWAGQAAWLEADLKAHVDSTWRFAQYHRPMRAHTAAKAEGLLQIAAWAELFYEYDMDLVIECDTHMVKRTYPLRPSLEADSFESFVRDDANGTVFIGEGSWGAPIRAANDDKPWTMASDSFHQFQWIQVTEDNIDVRSVMFDNVDEVESVSDDAPFLVPEALKLWQPPTGAVLRLPFDADDPSYTEGARWVEVLPPNTSWRYNDDGEAPDDDWQAAEFDDSDWASGDAPLGYGDDGEATVLSFGPDPEAKHPAYYFRTTFSVEDLEAINQFSIEVLADDGFIAYLNGEEIGRHNMPEGEVGHDTYASGHVKNAVSYARLSVRNRLLIEGENTLAIEVHQNNAASSDMMLGARVRLLPKTAEAAPADRG